MDRESIGDTADLCNCVGCFGSLVSLDWGLQFRGCEAAFENSAVAGRQCKKTIHCCHSKDIKAPLLSDFEWVKVGAQHYDALCVFCHGAPGREASEFSEGLNPPAPELHKVEVQKQYSDAELYWIIKNGIRMTGMPAFGPTHEEKELWAIVAFTRRLPEMQAEDYRVVTERGEQKPPSDKHP